MSKILVTGCSGFIGNHLLKHPLFNDAVTVGRTPPKSGHKFEQIQLTENSDYKEVLVDVDVVVHLAGRAHVMSETARDVSGVYRDANTFGTLNLAKQAAQAGIRRFVFISSIKVLGDYTENGQPFTVNDDLHPNDAYSTSKAEAETGLIQLCADTNMEFVIIRPPLVYGAGVKGNFEKLLNFISMDIPLPIASVNNKRSMVSIDNLVDLISVCVKSPKAKNQTFLVSDDCDLSLPELVYELSQAGNYKIRMLKFPPVLLRLIFICLRKPDVYIRLCRSMQVDLAHTKLQLGWEPPFSVQQSMLDIWKHKKIK